MFNEHNTVYKNSNSYTEKLLPANVINKQLLCQQLQFLLRKGNVKQLCSHAC